MEVIDLYLLFYFSASITSVLATQSYRCIESQITTSHIFCDAIISSTKKSVNTFGISGLSLAQTGKFSTHSTLFTIIYNLFYLDFPKNI